MKTDLLSYSINRHPLWHTAEAIRRGHITVGFVGGSITEPEDGQRWPDKVIDWLVETYPEVTVDVENAAKGATGSLSSILYVEDEILSHPCDLVFVESAVNDGPNAWKECREGVLRKLLKEDRFDVVVTYTYCQSMYEDFLAGRKTESILDWEKLTEHYGLSSVFMSRYAFDEVMRGALLWEEWLPDGLHPGHAGSRYYARTVCELLEKEIADAQKTPYTMPAPLYPDHWGETCRFPFEKVERIGAWRLVHCYRLPTVNYILTTASMKSTLRFTFEGRGLIFRVNANMYKAGFRFRVDGGAWQDCNAPLPAWGSNATDWVKEEAPFVGLEDREHMCEIEPLFKENGRGSSFELCDIAVIR